jgi:hypothetical protein
MICSFRTISSDLRNIDILIASDSPGELIFTHMPFFLAGVTRFGASPSGITEYLGTIIIRTIPSDLRVIVSGENVV